MNRDRTQFERLVCPAGHQLAWEGRWKHVDHQAELLWEAYGGCPRGAAFPRTYYKHREEVNTWQHGSEGSQ